MTTLCLPALAKARGWGALPGCCQSRFTPRPAFWGLVPHTCSKFPVSLFAALETLAGGRDVHKGTLPAVGGGPSPQKDPSQETGGTLFHPSSSHYQSSWHSKKQHRELARTSTADCRWGNKSVHAPPLSEGPHPTFLAHVLLGAGPGVLHSRVAPFSQLQPAIAAQVP